MCQRTNFIHVCQCVEESSDTARVRVKVRNKSKSSDLNLAVGINILVAIIIKQHLHTVHRQTHTKFTSDSIDKHKTVKN